CVTVLFSCDVSRPGDTLGLQSLGRWEWHGRIVADADPQLTIARLRIDTTHGGGDVALVRYAFNPAVGEGDDYSITLGLEPGRARDLSAGRRGGRGEGGPGGGIPPSRRPAGPASPQAIGTNRVVNHNIFDLSNDAPGLLARLANALHVTTRAGVIRRTLFVNPG